MLGFSLALALFASGPTTVDRESLLNDVRVLSADDMQGRAPGTEGGLKARAYIERRFREAGVAPLGEAYARPFGFERNGMKIEAANLVGVIRGRTKPDEYVVVTAHYDHLGVRDGKVYNGADDNASGVAAITALGAWFAKRPPERSLLIVALDAEEGGLNGARTFVANPPVPKASIKLNVNLDMVSRSPKGELYAAGTYHYPQLKAPLERVAATAPVKLLFGHDRPELGKDDWTVQSDHAAFHRAGIPFVYFGAEDHPGYHQPSDDFEAITPDFFVGATETIVRAVEALDASPL